ncbi:MAG TPA: CoA-binding protein [Longimicrobium sp.]|nr:CoA-binding protein [Longimicrobium sp.]
MLDAVLRPRSIAVIGASRRPNTIGYQILENLVRHGFTGAVYPVNPTADAVHSIRAYPSVEDIPDAVDLALLVVPKQHVCDAAEACGRKGVRGLIVISAGFAEVGGSGVERQKRLMEIVRRYDMRLVGPNCMGVLNTAPDRSMNATFAPTMPPAGPVSFMSQSGAMGVTILDYAAEYGIGISQFVSVGNKPDVSGNDLIQYWAEDERTGVILMYLENFGNPRKFTQLAREITRRKPIIAVKSGRSVAGARAASSHTGALAGTDAATDALLRASAACCARTRWRRCSTWRWRSATSPCRGGTAWPSSPTRAGRGSSSPTRVRRTGSSSRSWRRRRGPCWRRTSRRKRRSRIPWT